MIARTIGASRWRLLEFLNGELARAVDPDGHGRLMQVVKLRRTKRGLERRCKGCQQPLPPGTRAWSSVADNGMHRMDRFCLACIGEP